MSISAKKYFKTAWLCFNWTFSELFLIFYIKYQKKMLNLVLRAQLVRTQLVSGAIKCTFMRLCTYIKCLLVPKIL